MKFEAQKYENEAIAENLLRLKSNRRAPFVSEGITEEKKTCTQPFQ